jgi:hypothetical protein
MTMPGYAAGRTLPYDVALDRVDSPEIRYIPPGTPHMAERTSDV